MNRPFSIFRTIAAWSRAGASKRSHLFVIGAPRSGTTLLKTLLVAHSRIGGTDYESTGIFRVRDLMRIHISDLPPQQVRTEFLGSRDIVQFYDGICDAVLAKRGKDTFCDKLTIRAWRLRWVARHFPNARFVNIVRDCRDGYCSALGHENVHQSGSLRQWSTYWRRCVKLPAASVPADRLRTVRYEDLTGDPVVALTSLMNWLGLDFEPTQIDPSCYARTTSIKKREVHQNLSRPINTASNQRWRRELTDAENALAVRIAGRQLEEFGYQLT